MTIRNEHEYSVPLHSAQVISPTATSRTLSGVARIASKVFVIFSLKNVLNVESITAPFIAEDTSKPGAT